MYQQPEHYLSKDLIKHSTLEPDTLETIERLRNVGVNIGSTNRFSAPIMTIVAETAKEERYSPDFMATFEDVEGYDRPSPCMIHKNMQYFRNKSVGEIIKVGDTVSDIQGGKNAGMLAVGVIKGSSLMGISYDEYQKLEMGKRIVQNSSLLLDSNKPALIFV